MASIILSKPLETKDMKVRPFLAALACTLLGCTTQQYRSEPVLEPVADGFEKGGLTYSLPQSIVTITGTIDGGTPTIKVNTSYVPDSDASFRMRYRGGLLSADDVKVGVSGGLLSSADTSFEDKTGQILITLAKTAATAAQLTLTEVKPSLLPPASTTGFPFSNQYTLPELANLHSIPHVKLNGLPLTIQVSPDDALMRSSNYKCSYSVCFRHQRTIELLVSGHPQHIVVADERPIATEGVNLLSETLITRQTILAFDQGFLTQIEVKKPSTGLAIVSLPLDIAKAILSVPAELIQFKVDYSSKQETLASQDASAAKAAEDELKARLALQKCKADPANCN
jgi:hypothetical protein